MSVATQTAVTGWEITGTGNLRNWRAVELPPLYFWRGHECDACGTTMEMNAVACIRNTPEKHISDGVDLLCCGSCGSVQYSSTPNRSWLDAFYSAEWDAAGNATPPTFAENACSETMYLAMMHGLVKPGRKGIDVGCGFGQDMLMMKRSGMEGVGIEPSKHRAKIAEDRTNWFVFPEDADRCGFDFFAADLITCHEVLEHVYNPSATVAKFASWQRPGGCVVASVPNLLGEPTLGVLLFLPHLRSFAPLGFCELFRRHGYAIAALHQTAGNTIVVAKLGGNVDVGPTGNTIDAKEKIRAGLGLDRQDRTSLRWQYDCDYLIDGAGPNVRELFVEPIEGEPGDVPTIRWHGPLQLFVK